MSKRQEILYKIIGERIKQYRELANLTQDALANKSDVSRSSISNFEVNKHQAPIHTLYKVCQALSISIIDLLPTEEQITSRLAKESIDEVYDIILQNSLASQSTVNVISQHIKK